MSGSSDTLLRHRPLRTVRASFPAYGSSLYKFLLGETSNASNLFQSLPLPATGDFVKTFLRSG
ncbi:hypothetical protein FUB07_10465 [Vibrio cholerae]|nr:hypothetical protein [Vibrio cholerae]